MNNHPLTYTHIRQLLTQLQTGKVNQAEQQLMAMAGDTACLQQLLFIMKQPEQIEWVKTLAASVLNRIFTDTVDVFTQGQLYEAIMSILTDPAIKSLDKRTFQKSIIKLLEQGSKCNSQYMIELREKCMSKILQMLQQKPYFDTAYLLLACFAVSDLPLDFISTLIHLIYETTLTSLQVCIQNANLLNEMIKMWIVVFDKFEQLDELTTVVQMMVNYQGLYDIIDLVYEMQAEQGVIVCLNEGLYELNMLKYQAAQLNKRAIIYSNKLDVTTTSPACSHLKKNILKLTSSLELLALNKTYLSIQNSQDLTTTLFSLANLYIDQQPQIALFDILKMLNSIVFPFLKITQDQLVSFEQAPIQFNTLNEDCCDRQTYGVLKTECAKLLQNLGGKYPAAEQYIVTRCIQSLKYKLEFVHYPITGTQLILQIQTALLILAIFSYALQKYPQQMSQLKIMLLDQRISTLQPLDLARVFGLFAYNYSEVFKQPSDGEKLIMLALKQNRHPTTVYAALDFLSNMVQEFYSQLLLEMLTCKINSCKNTIIWEIIQKLIKQHYSKISTQGFKLIFLRLYQRIDKQVMQINQKTKSDTLDIVKCLQLFVVFLLQVQDQIKREQDYDKAQQLLQLVWKVAQFYKVAQQMDLEDQIVKIGIRIVKCSRQLDGRIHAITNEYVNTFKNNGYFEKVYLKYFNQVIMKAHFERDINCLISIIITIKDAFLKTVTEDKQRELKKSKPIQPKKVMLGCIIIVLQNIVGMHGADLVSSKSNQFFVEISSLCIILLPSSDTLIEKGSCSKIIMSRALNLLILCHLHLRADAVYDYLKRIQNQDLYHGYDANVLVVGLCRVLFMEADVGALAGVVKGMVQILIHAEEKDQAIIKKTNKKHVKETIRKNLKKITDFDKFLINLTTAFPQTKNSRDTIRQTLVLMRHSNPQIHTYIMQALPINIQQALKQIADIDHLFQNKRVIRKVKYGGQGKIQRLNMQGLMKKMEEEGEAVDSDWEQTTGNHFKRMRAKVKATEKSQKEVDKRKGVKILNKPRKMKNQREPE